MSVTAVFDSSLRDAVADVGLNLHPGTMGVLRRHFEMVVARNEVMNLTRITHPAEAAVKHYADSLALVAWAERAGIESNRSVAAGPLTVLDIGTGAGFPAVPIAVVRPNWSVTAIDGTRKKVDFLREAIDALGLSNLQVEHAHAAHWETKRRFDIVTSRAVAKLDEVIELSARFVRPGGFVVAYKTAELAVEERDVVKRSIVGLSAREPFYYELTCSKERLARALYAFQASPK